MNNQLYEGNYTSYIYGLIKDQNYLDAIKVLNLQLEMNPSSRAALSLLGYCYYLSNNYVSSAEMYEQLSKYYSEVPEYQFHLAQSLYKAENYEEALKACNKISKPELIHQTSILKFAILYQMNELLNANETLESAYADRQETLNCQGCILYKEGKYEEAKNKFEEAKLLGETPDIIYNIGVCCFKLKLPTAADICFQNILEHAARTHPDVVVQNRNDGLITNSVANKPAL